MKSRSGTKAFSLVELVLALGVVSFCMIALFALLPTGQTTNAASIQETEAVNVLAAVEADLRATPNSATSSSQFVITIPSAGGTATSANSPVTKYIGYGGNTVTTSAGAQYQLSIWMTPPPAGSRQATIVRLLLTSPAAAPIANAAQSLESVIALDRN
jgi:type II secretory pathway pseudopilin PulG